MELKHKRIIALLALLTITLISNYTIAAPLKDLILKPAIVVEPESVSMSNLTTYFKGSYSTTFLSTLAALIQDNATVKSYNIETGEIITTLHDGKTFYIIISQEIPDQVLVRITPADGNYKFALKFVQEIFSGIKDSLTRF